jgi:hypothetical protein
MCRHFFWIFDGVLNAGSEFATKISTQVCIFENKMDKAIADKYSIRMLLWQIAHIATTMSWNDHSTANIRVTASHNSSGYIGILECRETMKFILFILLAMHYHLLNFPSLLTEFRDECTPVCRKCVDNPLKPAEKATDALLCLLFPESWLENK